MDVSKRSISRHREWGPSTSGPGGGGPPMVPAYENGKPERFPSRASQSCSNMALFQYKCLGTALSAGLRPTAVGPALAEGGGTCGRPLPCCTEPPPKSGVIATGSYSADPGALLWGRAYLCFSAACPPPRVLPSLAGETVEPAQTLRSPQCCFVGGQMGQIRPPLRGGCNTE